MSACLESTRRPVARAHERLSEAARTWLRLAFACLAIVAGGLPAPAAAPQPEVCAAVAMYRPAQARPAARASVRRLWLSQTPRSLGARIFRPAARAAPCAQAPPRTPLFLTHRALLR